MNQTKRLGGGLGIVLCSALLGALTGCVGYVDGPRHEAVYAPPPPAYVEASVAVSVPGVVIRAESDFYEPLTAYGRWEVVGSHGRCWIPGRVEANWRPYSEGYWQRTDAGWYWASEEPWAWATYHYGRWDLSAQFGWYWVPQTQWAPAWVSWHRGGGYIGWAPLYPSSRFARGGSLEVDVRVISPRAYVFVEQRHFLEPVRPSTVVVNNTTIINQTVNITNTKIVNNTVINEGPATAVIEQESGRKVQAVSVRELRRKEEAGVVAKQRTTAPASAVKPSPPVRSEPETRAQKTVAPYKPAPVEKPAEVTRRPVEPAPRAVETRIEKSKPAPVEKPAEVTRRPVEPAPRAVETRIEKSKPGRAAPEYQPATRPVANPPAAIKPPARQAPAKTAEIKEKPVKPAEGKALRPPSEKPSARDQQQPKSAGKGRVKKVKE